MDYEVIPKDELSRTLLRQRFIERCGANLDFYIDKLNELAEGVWVYIKTPDGTMTKSYKRPPDIRALTYIKDQLIGKPSEHKFDSDERKSQSVITMRNIIKSYIDDRPKLSETGVGQEVSVGTFLERPRDAVHTNTDSRDNS